MDKLEKFSNIELINELMNRAISHEELDKICKSNYPENIVTVEEFSTNVITISLWGPTL